MFLFSAIAIAAALVIRVEVILADRSRQSVEAFAAAQGALNVAIAELRTLPSWAEAVDGSRHSQLSDGSFSGSKNVPGGGAVNLCCGAGSMFDRLAMATRASPLPVRRGLVWRPFLWTPFDVLAPRVPPGRLYVLVFVADDEEDVSAGGEETNGMVLVRAEAVDPGGVHRTVEALVARHPFDPADGVVGQGESDAEPAVAAQTVSIVGWREVR